MTTDRLSGLGLMNMIHYERPVDYDAVAQTFAEQQPRRKLLDPIFEEASFRRAKLQQIQINDYNYQF